MIFVIQNRGAIVPSTQHIYYKCNAYIYFNTLYCVSYKYIFVFKVCSAIIGVNIVWAPICCNGIVLSLTTLVSSKQAFTLASKHSHCFKDASSQTMPLQFCKRLLKAPTGEREL